MAKWRGMPLTSFWELAIGLQVTRFVRRVFEYNIRLGILIVSQPDQYDITLINPHLLPQLAPNVAQPFDSVEAHGL